ncbi:MAG TPA: hypothetical protein VKV04_17180 [Verrucomicrobiae bacterium]|nr:hypothetical protein [Verrucomicrobiae bacterium]
MRWHFCNVLSVAADTRHLWQFDARNANFNLSRDQTARNGEQLPPNLVGKSWSTLVQKKLNVAWLPSENVFLRVAQFPAAAPEETRSMVELQLEKLSPIPVTQALWTMHVLPQAASRPEGENLQTVIVTVVSREGVEEFLGKLEGQGYMADRLEVPMLDQLQATRVAGDGAWVYPEPGGAGNHALVAWWYGGVLQNLAFLRLERGPEGKASFKDQLVQMAWAGELEGWLTSAPRWHLVAEGADEWQSALREALDQPVEVVPPLPVRELASLTAKRAAQESANNNLLPPEFASRYQQQFVDRLWGRGLLAALVVYGIALAIYFVALGVFSHLTAGVQQHANSLSGSYTNYLAAKAKLGILQEREVLKSAALDCWEAVAETMPTGLTLDTMNFSDFNDARRLSLAGTAPSDQVLAVSDFYEKLRKWETRDGKALFGSNEGGVPSTSLNPGGATVRWSFDLELKEQPKR